MAALSESVIAVIGLSGGGSHVVQQLLHAGAGTIIVIDPELVDETNLRRLVLATRADVNLTPKVDLAWRAAQAIRPTTRVVRVRDRFPSTSSLTVLRHADLIVGCLDSWDSRDDLNTFAVTHAIPYIDIGATITAGTGSRPTRLHGQVVVVEPGGPCLRCVGLVTDDRVRASQEAHLGYRDGEADAQVVSLNGTLASEAVTAAMMLLAGAPVRPRRRYRFPDGELSVVAADRDPGCPACALGPSPYP